MKGIFPITSIMAALFFAMATTASAQFQWGSTGNGGSGTWNGTSTNWYNGTVSEPWVPGNTGTFTGTSGTVTVSGTQTASQLTFSNPSGTYTLTGGNLGISSSSGTLTIETDADAIIQSNINNLGSTGTLTKTGTSTLMLTGTNTFSRLAVNAGMLSFQLLTSATSPTALGQGPISLGVAGTSSGTLNFAQTISGQSATISANITAQGNGNDTITVNGPTGSFTAADTLSLAGTVTIKDTTLHIAGLGATISGPILGTTANSKLSVDGPVILSGTNSTISSIAVADGSQLVLTQNNTLSSTAVITLGQASALGLGLSGSVSQTLAGLYDSAAKQGIVSNASSSGTSHLTINNSVDDTYYGQIGLTGPAYYLNLSLTKTGSGTLTLSGTHNTYNGGTAVNGGALIVTNTSGSATGTGSLSVSSGGTVGGSGIINASTIAISGNVRAGMGGTDTTSILTMTAFGPTTFNNANLVFNLNAAVPGQSNELALQASPLVLFTTTTLTLNLQNSGIIPDGTQFTLLTSTGTGTGSGIGGSIFGGDITYNSTTGVISGLTTHFSTGGYGNSYLKLVADGRGYDIDVITVSSVPEPGTWLLLLSGFGFLGFYHLRKGRNL